MIEDRGASGGVPGHQIFLKCSSNRDRKKENQMAKNKKLLFLNLYSRECGRQNLSRALSHVKPDGKVASRPAWFMSTSLNALDRHVALTGRLPTKAARERYDPVLERQILEVMTTGGELHAFLSSLRDAPTVEDRRRLVEKHGKVFGRHERALVTTIGEGAHARLCRNYVNEMLGEALHEVFTLCEWRTTRL
jgi:hypothetical protein